jgi:DHA2 family multidrug resistance protein
MLDPNLLQILGSSGDVVLAMANAEINRQAAMIGYLNDFWAMAIVTAVSVPLVVFLRRPKGPVEKPDPAAAGH